MHVGLALPGVEKVVPASVEAIIAEGPGVGLGVRPLVLEIHHRQLVEHRREAPLNRVVLSLGHNLQTRGGQIQIKSNRRNNNMFSNQIKSNHRLFENRQIKSNHEAKNRAQIKSNHDLICISNQNFGRYQTQATARVKFRFHRQVWHRSKAISELFLSVRLVSPESMI